MIKWIGVRALSVWEFPSHRGHGCGVTKTSFSTYVYTILYLTNSRGCKEGRINIRDVSVCGPRFRTRNEGPTDWNPFYEGERFRTEEGKILRRLLS